MKSWKLIVGNGKMKRWLCHHGHDGASERENVMMCVIKEYVRTLDSDIFEVRWFIAAFSVIGGMPPKNKAMTSHSTPKSLAPVPAREAIQLKIENWKLKIENWKLKIENWKLIIDNWKWKIENWKLKMKNGKWKVDSGKLKNEEVTLSPRSRRSVGKRECDNVCNKRICSYSR